MPYDQRSFLAGFAAGRTLWKPPFPLPEGQALGWTADSEWLVFAPGILGTAEHSTRTPYIKLNYGQCVGVYAVNGTTPNYGNDWVGIFLISTHPDFMTLYLNTESGWWTSVKGTCSYLGLTWYYSAFNQNGQYGGGTSIDTDLPVFDATGYVVGYPAWTRPTPPETIIAMLQAANVRRD